MLEKVQHPLMESEGYGGLGSTLSEGLMKGRTEWGDDCRVIDGKLIWEVYIYVIPFQLLPFACLIEVIPDSDVVNVI